MMVELYVNPSTFDFRSPDTVGQYWKQISAQTLKVHYCAFYQNNDSTELFVVKHEILHRINKQI